MGALVDSQISGNPLVVLSGQQERSLITLEGNLTKADATNLPRFLFRQIGGYGTAEVRSAP